MPNWKSPDPGLVQWFWLKNFSSLRESATLKLKECLDSGFVSSWLTRGRTSLLLKDKSKANVASNYRPIICLPLMWKLLTGVIADQIYAHLDHKNETYKILWDFSIQTDHVIEAQISDFVLVDRKEKSCKIIDFAAPGDSRIEDKDKDKI